MISTLTEERFELNEQQKAVLSAYPHIHQHFFDVLSDFLFFMGRHVVRRVLGTTS